MIQQLHSRHPDFPGEGGASRAEPVTDPSVMPGETVEARLRILQSLQAAPLPPRELIRNLGLYMLPMELKRYLFFADLYQQILSVPGIIVEFGCRWGQNLAVLQSLGVTAEHCLYVGDTATDMQTAKAVDMYSVGVTWGFRPRQELVENGAHALIDHPAELLQVLGVD